MCGYQAYSVLLQAVASVELQNVSVPIRFTDVNKLVLWVMTSTGSSINWAQVKNIPLVEKFLVVYACGIDRALWELKKVLQTRNDLGICYLALSFQDIRFL